MLDLTFGEQVKIILKRRGMTIKELAEIIGERTGKKMSRQNLTQRLGRDNFQEQDMRMIAEILECPFYLNILDDGIPSEKSYIRTEERQEAKAQEEAALSAAVAVKEEDHSAPERDITIGELVDIHEELDALKEEQAAAEEPVYEEEPEVAAQEEPVYEEEPVYAEEPEEAAQEEPVYEEEPEEAAQEELVYAEEPEAAEEETAVTEEPAPVEERREKKHSWRDYLRRRKKKTEEVAATEEETAVTEEPAPAEETSVSEESVYDEEEFQEAEYEETAYEETGYEEEMVEELEEPQEEMRSWAEEEEDLEKGDVNPYTGREYQSNSVRMHPTRIGYVQVYDRGSHQWTDMTEWAFLGYQERKKALLGKDYDPPIYLD